ncbi:MAG: NADH-quinone oxidoreductase subunit NuoF [Desulfobacterales bacterium]|nr:NADH-quinone oxidoreductase subunit NuoF [Desulfobacterales bacterium]
MARLKSPDELKKVRQDIISRKDPNKPCISICAGAGCLAIGASDVIAAFRQEIEKQGLRADVDTKGTGCPGFCERGPVVVIYPEEICYLQVKPEDVPEIVSQTIIQKKVVDRLVYVDPSTGEKTIHDSDIPFYKYQERNIIGNNIKVDPKNIDDYLALGGYSVFAKVLFQMTPEQVVAEVKKSNLRGRGGGGFPTGIKWEATRNAPGETKYVIVNADEGDPGAFMDRAVLEGNPHLILEGLLMGAYAIGSHEGYIYVRQEYPLTVENVGIAIRQAEDYGLIGENILGSGFDFTVKVHRGAGAFVCGEETSLLRSLEGRPGEPRARPPYPAVKGLWDKPTNINNVETWANIPLIIHKGADFFTSIGTAASKGTKIFSLVGKINNTGLVEVPMGITLKDIIYKIGGGIPGGKRFKAVQTGGPSGGCIPADQLDMQVDFDELAKAGSIMGSGGMIVMDEDTCMVDFARYFLNFLIDESCGKCMPCREGIRQMLKILTDICSGKGKESDIGLLEKLSRACKAASLCALGKTAPNPFLSTLRYFRDEYEAHIREKRCPAYVCKALIAYHIDPDRCTACMICLRQCPAEAVVGGRNRIHVIDQDKCTKCGTCYEVCPPRFGAVKKISGGPVPASIPEEARIIVRKSKQK